MPAYDAIIIGTGQAGPPLAGRLSAAGQKVAIIERNLVGGTCVNTGCTPTKTLVASAKAAQMARRAAEYGVVIEGAVGIDMRKVKARADAVSGASRDGVTAWIDGMENCTLYRGHARFLDARRVQVGDDELTADRIFINVGGRAAIPDIPGIADVPHLTNSTMMDIDAVPEHLLVIGGSYVGLEFAQAYRRFGARVTVFETGPRLVRREDEDISRAIAEILSAEGIDIVVGATNLSVHRAADGTIVLSHDGPNGLRTVSGSHLLVATGRRPNTDDLDVAKAGIALDAHGYVMVDDALKTNVDGIWALGDCNGRGAFTHTSYNDFEIVAANLLDDDPRRVTDRIPVYALYTDPPLGRVGFTEAEAIRTGKRVLVSKRPMTRVSRAIEKGETQGFMKIVADADSGEILGAALLGTGCDEAVHSLIDVMYARRPFEQVRRGVHIHPTVSELLPTMLAEFKPALLS
ncbi:mercuric reductase [Kaistia sp. 32K]|uniref:FAD-containing oxidoreductase n=1 Tax=Kaistia sp. 32K TaxID=2795690 RepID=UPI0019169428|nr:FAD-containing oxidoreductase [Kaistia sp. 32K]BCP51399.1 mercuric reductase [Kaistia sp. 32K]